MSIQSNKQTRRNLTRVTTPMVLVAFFVYGVSPSIVQGSQPTVNSTEAQQKNFSFTPPTTINNQTEEVEDYNQFNNEIPKAIPVDSSRFTVQGSQNSSRFTVQGSQNSSRFTVHGSQNDFKSTPNPSFIPLRHPTSPSHFAKATRDKRLQRTVAGSGQDTNSKGGELRLTTFINYLQSFLIASYTTKPTDNNALLSNYQTYLYLKQQAKKRKDKALNKNNKDFNTQKNNLLTKLQQFLKNLKNKFQTKLNNYQSTKSNLINRLQTVKQTITNLTNQLNQTTSLKQRLQQALANFNYFQKKEREHRQAYDRERREYKHDKKKYKKYKHKYKKKHKKKYKKRYKKYKKRYKAHKDRARREKERYNYYERKKTEQARLYNQLKQQLNDLNNKQTQLNSLKQEELTLQSNLNNLIPPIYNNTLEEEAKQKYQEDLNKLNISYQNKQREIEDNYQKDLRKAEVYKEYTTNPQPHTLTKAEQEEILKQLDKKENESAKSGDVLNRKNNQMENDQKSKNNYNLTNPFIQQLKNLQATLATKQQEETNLTKDLQQAINNNTLGGATIAITKSIPYTVYETVTKWVDKWVTKYRKVKRRIKETLYRKVKKYKTIYKRYKQKVTYYIKSKVKKYYYITKTKVKYIWKKVTSWIKRGWRWFKKKVKKRFKKVYRYTKKITKWVTKKVKKVKTIWKTVKYKIKYYVKEKYHRYKTIIQTVKEKIKTRVKKTFQKAVTKYRQITQYIKTKVKQGVNKAKNFIASLRQKLHTVENTINSLKSKIQEVGKRVREWYNEKRERRKKLFTRLKIKIKNYFLGNSLPEKVKPSAKIAEDVYGDKDVTLPDGVRKITDRNELQKYGLTPEMLRDDKSGFLAGVYINDLTGELTIAYAGTKFTSLRDWVTNFGQAIGFDMEQYQKARDIAYKIKGKIQNGEIDGQKVSFVGHSLGGGLAALSGAITKAKTITFNAAGVNDKTLRNAGVDRKDIKEHNFSNITNYVHRGEILTYVQEDSTIRFLAPDALGKQVRFGIRWGMLIPAQTLALKGIKLVEAFKKHSLSSK